MELLLILSALLSAVTGAFTGARAPEARPLHAAASLEVTTPAVPSAVKSARVAAVTGFAPVFLSLPPALPERPAFALTLPAPLETVRLLE